MAYYEHSGMLIPPPPPGTSGPIERGRRLRTFLATLVSFVVGVGVGAALLFFSAGHLFTHTTTIIRTNVAAQTKPALVDTLNDYGLTYQHTVDVATNTPTTWFDTDNANIINDSSRLVRKEGVTIASITYAMAAPPKQITVLDYQAAGGDKPLQHVLIEASSDGKAWAPVSYLLPTATLNDDQSWNEYKIVAQLPHDAAYVRVGWGADARYPVTLSWINQIGNIEVTYA
ncbi:MAG: hypothetical protein H0X24_10610 [Ktedonobacterales bacterium]|nr:hypothetical protein [Ktedonobacterales bacterium]